VVWGRKEVWVQTLTKLLKIVLQTENVRESEMSQFLAGKKAEWLRITSDNNDIKVYAYVMNTHPITSFLYEID